MFRRFLSQVQLHDARRALLATKCLVMHSILRSYYAFKSICVSKSSIRYDKLSSIALLWHHNFAVNIYIYIYIYIYICIYIYIYTLKQSCLVNLLCPICIVKNCNVITADESDLSNLIFVVRCSALVPFWRTCMYVDFIK